ncbi:MAG: type II secretion system protein [Candidatus Portnoybacteria bacterium]|nr:type II secretion system protein [Candidatus Portnoybacteria bacterium]
MRKGFTLVEYLIYIVIFGLLSSTLLFAASRFITLLRQTHLLREMQDDARLVGEEIAQEAQNALSIYTPTSVFNTSPGQVSLETKSYLPTGETTTYVDFYLASKGIYRKREGSSPTRLTSQGIEVTSFVVRHLTQAQTPALRIEYSLDSKDLPGGPIPFTITASLRPNK